MIASLIERLNSIPLAGLMLVVALGYALGRLRWRWLSPGPGGGTLLVAILFGWLGLDLATMYGSENPTLTVGEFGFALFIYSVGFEAGPRFFSILLGGPGWRFVVVGTVVNVCAVLVAVLCARLMGFGATVAAGSLAGALTSFPTYAAAAESLEDPNLIIFFALTYPVGLVGVILFVQLVPRLAKLDLTQDTEPEEGEDAPRFHRGPDAWRVFRVAEKDVLEKTLGELDLTHRTGCYVVRLHRDAELLRVDAGTRLEKGDRLLVQGRPDELKELAVIVGPEVADDLLGKPPSRNVVVLRKEVSGRSLAELDLTGRHRCLVTALDRGGVHIEPAADVTLCHGDVLTLTGPRRGVRGAAIELGRFEKSVHETDIAIYAGGIFLGLLLSQLRIGGSIVIGSAGGLLLAGVVLGRLRRIGPLSANVPRAARHLVRDLGILLFIAEMGIWAGSQSLEPVRDWLLPAAVAALFITTVWAGSCSACARWTRGEASAAG